MVMDTPTAQCVGREFVRQYYTMLNQSPLHLHRFYSQNSSFIHGGIDRNGHETKAVVGQQEIHEKIMQLNFRDCHAKILQVDSHETLEKGVVVQVTGDLSNNGQPMKRFVQTFVLEPQSPKKYYVRNDIFRYQDDFYNDDETETQDVVADTENDEPNIGHVQEDTANYYDNEVLRNGNGHISDAPGVPTTPTIPMDVDAAQEAESENGKDWDDGDENNGEEAKSPEPSDLEESNKNHSERKTYANMVSKTTPPTAFMSHSQTKPPEMSAFTKPDSVTPFNATGSSSGSGSLNASPSGTGVQPSAQPQRMTNRFNNHRTPQNMMRNDNKDFSSGTPITRMEDGQIDSERRKPAGNMYPDSLQLFVGNLPHKVSEEDMKQHFMSFGKVLEFRINAKQQNPKLPNYGFVVFEDQESVKKVLHSRPVLYNSHRLNVEEKKARPKDNPHMGMGDGRNLNNRGMIGGRLGGNLGNMGRGGGGGGGRGGSMGAGGTMHGGSGRGENRGGRRGGVSGGSTYQNRRQ